MSDIQTGKKIAIRSIGCRTNQQEMDSLRFRLLQDNDYCIVDDIKDADIIVINTCTVTSFTETKTRRMLKGISDQNPNARIMLTGCLAQQKPLELKEIDSVAWVVGNNEKSKIPDIIKMENGIFHNPFDLENTGFEPLPSVIPYAKQQAGFRTRFPVKIQEGCNFCCSYCIVPYVRGPSRSAEINSVVDTCKTVIDSGYKEIVLTGTHIGQFGKGPDDSLCALLRKIIRLDGDFRVRLSSLDPRDFSDEIVELIGDGRQKICDHLHISLQSLNPKVLSDMNRPYSNIESLIKRLIHFRELNPSAGLGSDFIVGFPGESEEDFNLTLERVESIGFSYAHVFRFSARPGTLAAKMPAQVSETDKTERSDRFRGVIEKSKIQFLLKNNTVSKKIIVESEYPVRGLTSNYIHVEVPGVHKECNSWMDVTICGSESGRFQMAKPVSEKVQ